MQRTGLSKILGCICSCISFEEFFHYISDVKYMRQCSIAASKKEEICIFVMSRAVDIKYGNFASMRLHLRRKTSSGLNLYRRR